MMPSIAPDASWPVQSVWDEATAMALRARSTSVVEADAVEADDVVVVVVLVVVDAFVEEVEA